MNKRWRKIFKTLGKSTLWIAGIWLFILVILEVSLSQSVLTGLINKYAAEYIQGELKFGNISASMFRRFPNIVLNMEDFSITYPSDKFDKSEKSGVQGHLMYSGCGESSDTLASFNRFTASLNIPALISGTIHIPYLGLESPRIFVHSYSDGRQNIEILNLSDDTKDNDTVEVKSALPKIILGKIRMSGKPEVVYTDSPDTLFAKITLKRLGFNGKINTRKTSRTKVGLTLDSMFVAGRLGRDTIAAGLDRLYIHQHNDHIDVDAAAKTFAATHSFGRLMVPIDMKGSISFTKDTLPAIRARDISIDVAHVPILANADIQFHKGYTYVDAEANITECSIRKIIKEYGINIIPELKKIVTDASLSISATFNGKYCTATGEVPTLSAEISIPDSKISHSDLPGIEMALGLEGKMEDALGEDPVIGLNGKIQIVADTLAGIHTDSLNLKATGKLLASVGGNARLSQLNLYNFSSSSLSGEVSGYNISITMPDDSLDASIDSILFILGPEDKTSRRDSSKTMRLMGISGSISKADITYKDDIKLHTEDFKISAKNVIDTEVPSDTTRKIHPFGGTIMAGKLFFKDSNGSAIMMSKTRNGFQIIPQKENKQAPLLTVNSRNSKINLKSGTNRAMVSDADLRVSAAMNTLKRREKVKNFRDSLSKVYPDIPKDSLFRHIMAQRGPRPEIPEWMKEEDFKKQDIDIRLDKTLAKYFRDWDLKGKVSVRKGILMTPYFPMINKLEGFDLNFTNDIVAINQLAIQSGDSRLSATGELKGLKRALLGRNSILKLNIDVNSSGMNANQLLKAYNLGSRFNPESFKNKEEMSDDEFLEQIVSDTTAVEGETSLIVVPSNMMADINIDASNIVYSDLNINKLTSSLLMKERCIQITETQALSNMGEISLEGFYATRKKDDLKTGFSLNFKDITAEKVIDLVPAIDTIMPLLKSFGGKLNCELAATAQLDTNMNIIMPSINGIMRVKGENLTISENDMFKKVAKMLIFKNKKEGRIDKMTVEGVINNNELEVFPFILEMDRYTLGLSGVQNLDKSFKYHASLIKSPFLIKLGMDIHGSDFDNMKFKLGKAKYKNKNIPVFTTVIDQTRINLLESIRNIFKNGVEAAMKDNAEMKMFKEHKKKIGYVRAVDQKIEELSDEEQKQVEMEQESSENPTSNNNITNNEQSGIHRDGSEDNAVQ